MSDGFKIDEDSRKLKVYLTNLLNNIDSNILKFISNYDKNPKLKDEIEDLLYTHKISKRKKIVGQFSGLFSKTEKKNAKRIGEIQNKSTMKQKRTEELGQVKDFIKTGFLKMLPDGKEGEIKRLQLKDKSENIKEEINLDENNENILCDFTKKEEKKDDDILIEDDLKPNERQLTGRKRKKNNKEPPQNANKSKVIFKYCYICKTNFTKDNIHDFYSNLCKTCGAYNYSFRTMKLDFTGRVAIVTGGRVKIGYYIATKLLSYNCKVLITSRFPKDTLLKYQEENDYQSWKNNLIIYPIDFRIFESTVKFVKYIEDNFKHVDILINNAAQTIRRTASYYKYLLPNETKKLSDEQEKKIIKCDYINLQKQLDPAESKKNKTVIQNALISLSKNDDDFKSILPLSVIASQIKIMDEKPQSRNTIIGSDGQPFDFSAGKNSWNYEFDEIPFQEFTEVQIINAWTPYYLSVKLKPLMQSSPFFDRYIVNVTSVEGMFNHYKRTTHVHTNMAKASLNMFTRTAAGYLSKSGIYMTCVDTGWVSPMNEVSELLDAKKKESYEAEYVNVPLDELDGAMRVLHPVIEGIKNKNYMSGIMLKDYRKCPW